MNNMNVKQGDKVVVLSGKDKGTVGEILVAMPKSGKVVVKGVNVCSCHTKPRRQGDEGGIIQKECPIYVSKVMLVCPKCDKPTRVGHTVKDVDGKKKSVRVCKKCGAEI
ncbi:MAG: 50S ribosomal protein L24 [Clostridiales bacterium]|nr:50S ribosomal protein L24 [Clostridiales bacterium]MCD7837403.1 50S ribosomal protein L24 [Clostridiales bacterium]MCD8007521.1 50S ribosomal protein L24 [Clostridiales bacterium]MCD8353353.1 50S ribosomal protein L24 [Clostridiales bacterium]